MYITQLFDPASAIFVFNSVFIGFLVGGKKLRKSLSLARDISIPIGVCGTLLGFIMMLGAMDDPSAIGPAMAIGILCLMYGLIQFMILNSVLHRIEVPAKETTVSETINLQTLGACLLLLVFIATALLQHANLPMIVNIESGIIVFVGAPLLAYLESNNRQQRIEALGKYGLLTSFIAVLIAATFLLASWSDPTTIGPALALGLISLFYGGILYIVAHILYHSSYAKTLEFSQQGSTFFLSGTLLVILVPNLLLVNSMGNWETKQDLMELKKNMWEQNSLLRKMAPATATELQGHLTVSSDNDAWVFIDGVLIQQAPLYQFELPPGEHQIQIASCPNTSSTMYQQESEVSWLLYWEYASDGTCDNPSPAEIKQLIAEGKIKEIILSTEVLHEGEEIQAISYEFSPELNFCCDDNLTKEFTVSMKDDSLIYVWSFAKNEWLLNSTVQQKNQKQSGSIGQERKQTIE